MIDNSPQLVSAMSSMIDAEGLDSLKEKINDKVYKMLAKVKKSNKQINESVINKDDLLAVFKSINGTGLPDEVVALMQPLVQVNPNHGHIYQAKIVNFLIDEVTARREFMKGAKVEQTQNGSQVVSFKQLESDEEQ